jgi:hypothetical protein
MSEFEKEELMTRILATTDEEKILIASVMPSEILFAELIKRDRVQREKLNNIMDLTIGGV